MGAVRIEMPRVPRQSGLVPFGSQDNYADFGWRVRLRADGTAGDCVGLSLINGDEQRWPDSIFI